MWPSRPNQCLVEVLIPFEKAEKCRSALKKTKDVWHTGRQTRVAAGKDSIPSRTELAQRRRVGAVSMHRISLAVSARLMHVTHQPRVRTEVPIPMLARAPETGQIS